MLRKSSAFRPALREGVSLATIAVLVLVPALSTLAAPTEGGLSVMTEPAGASVYIDGESKGVTPLDLDAVPVGEHRITVWKEGYLENSRVVRVEAGERRSLELELTSSAGLPRETTQAEPAEEEGGGVPTWVWIAAAGGAGAATYMLVRDTNNPPECPGASVTPTTGLQAAQSFAFSAQASDPDGDTLSYNWDLGDGTTANSATATKVYNNAGSFNATLTVRDEKESATCSATATVRGMTGNWGGSIRTGDFDFRFHVNLSQNIGSVTGTFNDDVGIFPPGTVSGSVSGPNNATLTVSIPGFEPFNLIGTTSADVNAYSGTAIGSGFNDPFTLTRQ